MTVAKELSADSRYGTATLVRRLFLENALTHWRLYLLAFALMGLAAVCTALSAYLMRDFINQAYLDKNFTGILVIGTITIVIFSVRGAALYGQAVLMARVGTRILAANQRRMFRKLLDEGLGFFADRHSSELVARLSAGTIAATQVINLLITAAGRDFLTLAGLLYIMVIQDPLLSAVSLIVVPPAILFLRKTIRRVRHITHAAFTGNTRIVETMQETLHGLRTVKAFTLEEQLRRRFDANRMKPLTDAGAQLTTALLDAQQKFEAAERLLRAD